MINQEMIVSKSSKREKISQKFFFTFTISLLRSSNAWKITTVSLENYAHNDIQHIQCFNIKPPQRYFCQFLSSSPQFFFQCRRSPLHEFFPSERTNENKKGGFLFLLARMLLDIRNKQVWSMDGNIVHHQISAKSKNITLT